MMALAGGTPPPPPGELLAQKETGNNNFLLFIVLFLILGFLAIVLARIISNLNQLAQVKEGTVPTRRQTLVDTLTSKGVIGFVIFALIVLGGYTTVNNAIELGPTTRVYPRPAD